MVGYQTTALQRPGVRGAHAAARVLTAFGGAWVLIIGAVWAGIEVRLRLVGPIGFVEYEIAETAVETGCGAAILGLVWMERWHPDRHRLVGLLAIILGIVSLLVPPAGLLLGPAMAVLGGVLLFVFKP